MVLNIYHVERPSQSCSYDEYLDFLVICRDEETARRTHPSGEDILDPVEMKWIEKNPPQPNELYARNTDRFERVDPADDDFPFHWVRPRECQNLLVTHIGIANKDEEERVVMNHYVYG